jgi:Cu+-exporting ATPase
VVDGSTVLVGRASLLSAEGVSLPGAGSLGGVAGAHWGSLGGVAGFGRLAGGRSVSVGGDVVPVESGPVATPGGVAVAVDGVYAGSIVVADTVRESSPEALRRLRDLGLKPILLTGDSAATARQVATEVGIDDVIAEVLPADKVDVVTRLQAEGHVVAMVGDGVNDAAALAAADLGIAMGTGTDAAIEASALTLIRADLTAAADAIVLSRATLATIKGNLFWAFAYNVAALPLAAAGLVSPMIAAAAMALSSLFVVTNSLRLFRVLRG